MKTNVQPIAYQQNQRGPTLRYAFIQDDLLQAAPTVKDLNRPVQAVPIQTTGLEVLERFLLSPDLYAIPVIDDSQYPRALVDRNSYIEFFTRPYTREIFGKRPICDVLNSGDYPSREAIVVEDTCSLEDAAEIIINAGMQHMVTGFMVTRQGHYQGVANGHDLLNLITKRKQSELFYMAHYDHLTGIPNRSLLGDRLGQACLDAQRRGTQVGLLFIDLDRFKTINDSLGHSFGDAVLKTVVSRLQAAARSSDTVARLGGDEFVILMENLNDSSGADLIAQRLVESMRNPMDILGHSLVVTVSIGIAIFPRDDTDISRLLAKADAAMYDAKTSGRNGFRTYVDGVVSYDPSRLSLENDLRQAIEDGELKLYFQPQVQLDTEQILGVEALVRWQHPVRGMVSPLEFIPLAEESGLILPLGTWVLREACRQLHEWDIRGFSRLRMAINVSAVQFHQQDFMAILQAALEDSGVDPLNIELELTESVLMHNVEEVLKTLNAIRALGVSLAIDDFGTGFSSLNYLRRFPITRLKIDQSFVRDIEQTPANESITRAIIALAGSLSLEIVAEGIETTVEKSMLINLGCPEGQGFHFARPQPADDITQLIEENHLRSQATSSLS